jgi:hypothetical protein
MTLRAGNFAGGYNHNAAKLILAQTHQEHGRSAVYRMVKGRDLGRVLGF